MSNAAIQKNSKRGKGTGSEAAKLTLYSSGQQLVDLATARAKTKHQRQLAAKVPKMNKENHPSCRAVRLTLEVGTTSTAVAPLTSRDEAQEQSSRLAHGPTDSNQSII